MVDSEENGYGDGGRRSTSAKTAITLPNIQSAPMLVNVLARRAIWTFMLMAVKVFTWYLQSRYVIFLYLFSLHT